LIGAQIVSQRPSDAAHHRNIHVTGAWPDHTAKPSGTKHERHLEAFAQMAFITLRYPFTESSGHGWFRIGVSPALREFEDLLEGKAHHAGGIIHQLGPRSQNGSALAIQAIRPLDLRSCRWCC
jgi:hypothetical protein